MLSLFISAVAASEVCQNSMADMEIPYEECMAIQTEFNAMVDSGKSIDELETDLQVCSRSASTINCDATCGVNPDCQQTCMQIQSNGNCNVDAAGCARQVAYGGYITSQVLIQCYGTINEGCRRLPTVYQPVQYQDSTSSQSSSSSSGWPSCSSLCTGCCGAKTTVTKGNPNLRVGGTWSQTCMKQNFSRYLKCIGKRTAQCYRQKWIVSKQVVNAAPTAFPGCTKNFNMPYTCAAGTQCGPCCVGSGCTGCGGCSGTGCGGCSSV